MNIHHYYTVKPCITQAWKNAIRHRMQRKGRGTMAFGYAFLCGFQGAKGYIRETDGIRTVSVRGMKPGETCVLYVFIDKEADICDQKTADSDGHATLETARSGPLFVTQNETVRLWEGNDDAYLRACEFLVSHSHASMDNFQKETIKRKEEAPAANEAETNMDSWVFEPAIPDEKENFPQENISPAGKVEQEPDYTLRAPGKGEPVDTLPERNHTMY